MMNIDAAGYQLTSVGRLGVGTMFPQYALDANGDVNLTGQLLVNGTPLSVTAGANMSGGGALQGNVTLNAVPSGATGQLQINSAGAFGATGSLAWDDINSALQVGGDLSFYDTALLARIRRETDGAADSGALIFETAELGVMTERMRIDSQGQIGIGTQLPQTELHVAGQIFIEYDTSPITPYLVIDNRLSIIDMNGALYFIDLRYSNTGQLAFQSTGPSLLAVDFSGGASPKDVTLEARNFGGNTAKIDISTAQTIDLYTDDLLRIHIDSAGVDIGAMVLPNADPGAGTRRLWYDPADGNTVKFSP